TRPTYSTVPWPDSDARRLRTPAAAFAARQWTRPNIAYIADSLPRAMPVRLTASMLRAAERPIKTAVCRSSEWQCRPCEIAVRRSPPIAEPAAADGSLERDLRSQGQARR